MSRQFSSGGLENIKMKPHRIGIRGYLSDGPNVNRQWKFGEEMKLLFFQQWQWNYSQLLNWMLKRAIMDYNIPLEHIFSLELSFNVSSALKFNASVKLRLCTLYEDKIKWLSFVTIIVFNNDQKTAYTCGRTYWMSSIMSIVEFFFNINEFVYPIILIMQQTIVCWNPKSI